MPETQLWHEASAFAARAHRHQTRDDHQTPYFSHPVRVALTVSQLFGVDDASVIAAALLHDTIEDTGVDYDEVHEQFGREVADLVAVMTKDMRLPEAQREKAYDQQLADGPWQGRLLKLADVYDNLLSVRNSKSRRKQLEKAQRAVRLAENDANIANARRLVKQLIKAVEKIQ